MATFSPCHWHLTVQRLCPSPAPLPLFFSLLLCLSRVVLPRPLNYVALLGCSPGALLLNISFPFALFAGCLVCKMRRCQCQEFSHCVRNSCSSQTHTHTHQAHTCIAVCVCAAACVFLQQFLQQFFLFLPRTWQSRKFNFLFFVYVCEPHFLLSFPPLPPFLLLLLLLFVFGTFALGIVLDSHLHAQREVSHRHEAQGTRHNKGSPGKESSLGPCLTRAGSGCERAAKRSEWKGGRGGLQYVYY